VDPDRVGLVLALTIRCVPLLLTVLGEVNQARRARGLGFSLVALVAPAIVRALRSADAMGEALIARGVDD
jgi:biotin transport system permease protein